MTRKMGAGVSTLGMVMSTKGDTCVEFVVWFFSDWCRRSNTVLEKLFSIFSHLKIIIK